MTTTLPKNLDKVFLVAVFTTFMGQIYIRPFGTDFRLTLAVVVLNVLMLTFKSIPPVATINLVGLMMLFIRSAVFSFTANVPLTDSLAIYFPVLFFYLFYSIFFVLLKIRERVNSPLYLFLSLWICDSIPNIIEVLIRNDWQSGDFESIVLTITAIGLLRTLFTVTMIYFSQYYYSRLKKKEAYQQFIERVILMSNLKTELFFLKKSKKDIELAMQKSYTIYERLELPINKEDMLDVAKDIHEIKKDYSRVISGIERCIRDTSEFQMTYTEIVKIVFAAQEDAIAMQNKSIKLQHSFQRDFETPSFYLLISILNNLITNSVDAIARNGSISVSQKCSQDAIYLTVEDNGRGIEAEDLPHVFNPGYSTKYNPDTGVMSTGIGLAHVYYLVTTALNGSIEVFSDNATVTRFTMTLPLPPLMQRPDDPMLPVDSTLANTQEREVVL